MPAPRRVQAVHQRAQGYRRNLRGAGGNDLGRQPGPAADRAQDEVPQQGDGGVEIGDHPAAHRVDEVLLSATPAERRDEDDALAAIIEAAEEPSEFRMLYEDSASLRQKVEIIAKEVYGADGVDYLPLAARQIDTYEQAGFGTLPVCIAKTHLSISSDPSLKGAPTGWRLPVREARANVGAGFVYLVSGDMRTMPGLSSSPAAERIDIDDKGNVVGLY